MVSWVPPVAQQLLLNGGDIYSRGVAEKMKNTIAMVAGWLAFSGPLSAQDQPRQLKGGGHLLGEAVEQFYSEAGIAEMLRACQAHDWKIVSRLLKDEAHPSKNSAKDVCAEQEALKQKAMSGARLEFKGAGDPVGVRADTFTLDGGHLVKIDMVYSSPNAHLEGLHPKSFAELYEGLKEAYGEPTKSFTEPVLNAYGVQYDAHRAVWTGKEDVILIVEQPGSEAWTKIVAATAAEYDRTLKAVKTANPLE